MKDSPLIIPDTNFIEKFTQKKQDITKGNDFFLTVDAHVDLPYYMMSKGIDESFTHLSSAPFTLEAALSTNTRIFCTAIYCEDTYDGPGSEAHYQEVLDFAISHLDVVRILEKKEDLASIKDDQRSVFTILLLENADFLADDPRQNVTRLKEDGIKIVGLTHMGKNRLADGNAVAFPEGISDMGKEVIKRLLENQLIIDTAHLHPRCFWELLDLTEGRIICTHTGIREIFNTPRNLDLDQVKQIAERGGVVGITSNPEMLSASERVGLDTVFAHIDTVVQRFGPEVVGIGSDLGGFDKAPPELSNPQGLDRLQEILLSHGYDEQAIEAIRGHNWLRFFQDNL